MDSHKEINPVFNQQMIDEDFELLKDDAEQDSWEFVRNKYPKLSMSEIVAYHKVLEAKIMEYRNKKPPTFPNIGGRQNSQ